MEEAFKSYAKENGLPTHKDTRGLFMALNTRKAHRAFKAGWLAAHNAQRTTHNAQRTTHNAQRTPLGLLSKMFGK